MVEIVQLHVCTRLKDTSGGLRHPIRKYGPHTNRCETIPVWAPSKAFLMSSEALAMTNRKRSRRNANGIQHV